MARRTQTSSHPLGTLRDAVDRAAQVAQEVAAFVSAHGDLPPEALRVWPSAWPSPPALAQSLQRWSARLTQAIADDVELEAARLGVSNVGDNADWSVSAYPLGERRFLLVDLDTTPPSYHIVKRYFLDDAYTGASAAQRRQHPEAFDGLNDALLYERQHLTPAQAIAALRRAAARRSR